MASLSRVLRRSYHLVQVGDPDAVTTISSRERPAAEGGLDPAIPEAIWKAIVAYYRTGLQPAMQVAMLHRGVLVLDRAIGHAHGNEPTGMLPDAELATPDTLFNLFSASKSVLAMLVHQLDDEGIVHLDDPVEVYIPEFGQQGKHYITLRHVLTHRAGIPVLPGEHADLDLLTEPDRILRYLCEAKPTSRAGRRLAYHALTGGFVLAEICRRVTGQDLPTLLRERVSGPLGLEHFRYGVEPEDLPKVARDVFTGPPPAQPYAFLLERSLGVDIREAARLSADPRFLTSVVPAGNILTTARETVRFFECLRQGGTLDGVEVFGRRTVRRAVSEQSYRELDSVMMLPVRYGMGFMLGSEHLSFYGPGTTKAFGHLGFTQTLCWADPERQLSFALLCSGKPFICPDLVLWQRIMWTIASQVPRARFHGSPIPLPTGV
jgi:CubicO group peptidase (beta-lactamase class C family)